VYVRTLFSFRFQIVKGTDADILWGTGFRRPIGAYAGMDMTKTSLERAFELAESGAVATVDEIRTRLKAEGYSQQQISGRTLTTQLTGLIRKARPQVAQQE